MSKPEERSLAFTLYLNTSMFQSEIAERVGVSEKTLSRWINSEEWALQKAAMSVTRPQQVINYMMQIKEMNDQIKLREQKWATPGEADTIAKITRAIEVLSDKAALSEYIMVIEDLTKFLNTVNSELTRTLMPRFNEFIQHKAKELSR